jgi:hypothetical protein
MTGGTAKAMTRERPIGEAQRLFRERGFAAALLCGLQVYQQITPQIITPAVFGRACELLAGLYPDQEG